MARYLSLTIFLFLPLWTFAHNGVDDGDEIATSSWLHPPPAPDVIYQVHHTQASAPPFMYAGILILATLLAGVVVLWKKRRKNLL